MASLGEQIRLDVMELLEQCRVALDWRTLERNPREPVGEDQLNAILFMDGDEMEPDSLTGGVETCMLDFIVGVLVLETESSGTMEEQLDAAWVRICDTLVNPANIQLGGLAVDIEKMGKTRPNYGRAAQSGRLGAEQFMEFRVQYWGREGDASVTGT